MGYQYDSYSTDNKVGFFSGMIGGLSKYILDITGSENHYSLIFWAALTAAVSGLAGILAKEIYIVAKKALMAYFRSSKKTKKDDSNTP